MPIIPTVKEMQERVANNDKPMYEQAAARLAATIEEKYGNVQGPMNCTFAAKLLNQRVIDQLIRDFGAKGWGIKFEYQSDGREDPFYNVTIST